MISCKPLIPRKRARRSAYVETTTSAFSMLWATSGVLLDRAADASTDASKFFLGSLAFSAFALEAYLNHVGPRVHSSWNALETLSPQKKLQVLCTDLKIQRDSSKRPYQTVIQLLKFRNDVVHGQTVTMRAAHAPFGDLPNANSPLYPAWRKFCTQANAQRAREDVRKLVEEIRIAAKLHAADVWFSSKSIIRVQRGDS